MGKGTDIQWCDDTVNPTTGCGGCELWHKRDKGPCYAGVLHEGRMTKAMPALYAADFTEVRLAPGRMAKAAAFSDLTGKARPGKPWLDGRPRTIFVGDMGDILTSDVPYGYLYEEVLAAAMSPAGRRHTKRPKFLATFARWVRDAHGAEWPDNVWGGTSITTQATANRRIPELLAFPGKRFVSAEPLWEAVDFRRGVYAQGVTGDHDGTTLEGISWVIVGGQSGAGAKPFNVRWAEFIRDQCKSAGVEFFMKQEGSNPYCDLENDRGQVAGSMSWKRKDSHGGDWSEWQEDLRIREVPA
jgi:protein gp37